MMFPHPYFTVGRLGLKSKIIISNLNFEVVEVFCDSNTKRYT